MKTAKIAKILLTGWACCFSSWAVSGGLPDIGTGISMGADNQIVTEINQLVSFVSSDWSMLAAYYSQTSSFPAPGMFNVFPGILPNGNTITNENNGILLVTFGSKASGPLANNSFALAPTCVTLRGNTFYVYELPQCYTNITDSLTSQSTPQPGTVIGVLTKSNVGVKCIFASDPNSAASSAVTGCNLPSTSSALNNGI